MKKSLLLLLSLGYTLANAGTLVYQRPGLSNGLTESDIQSMKQHYLNTIDGIESSCPPADIKKYVNCGYSPEDADCRAKAYQSCQAAIAPISVKNLKNN